jgi:hypothetical protein
LNHALTLDALNSEQSQQYLQALECQPPKLLTPLVAKVIDPPQAYLADYFSPCDEETEGVA